MRTTVICIGLLVGFFANTGQASGGESTPSEIATFSLGSHLLHSPQLLNDPVGLRTRLADLGLTLELFWNEILGVKARGGHNVSGRLRHSGSIDFFAYADLGELGLMPSADFLLQVKSNYNKNINPDVMALSDPIDDADFDEIIYVSQLWLQQTLFEDRARMRIGYLDQQTVLDRNAYANSEDKQFMSTFLDNNPIVPLKIGLGATLFLNPTDWLELVLGTADADNEIRKTGFDTFFDGFSSLMGYFEADFRVTFPSRRGSLPGGYRLGIFYDASKKPVFGRFDPVTGEPERDRGHLGGYASFDQLVYREPATESQGLGVFFRYGVTDQDVMRIEQFWSTGLQYQGLLPFRERDVLGLGMYQTIESDRFRSQANPNFDRETGVEFYYRTQVTPWLQLTPNVQFIHSPGGSESVANALIFALRFRIAL